MESENREQPGKTREVKSWIMAARVHMKKKNNKEAEEVLRDALKQSPDSLDTWTELCILLLSLRRETDAERVGKQVQRLRKEKDLTWAQLRSELREKYIHRNQTPEIAEEKKPSGDDSSMYPSRVDSPRQQVRENPKSGLVVAGTKKSMKRETKPLDETENRTADNWYEFAKLYQKQEKYPDALRALWKVLELDPGKVDAQLRIGEVYIKQTKYTEAILWLNQVIAKNIDNAHAWYLLGVAHLELGKYYDASNALQESVKIDAEHIDAWAQLGISLAKQNRHSRAQKAFLRALKHKRNDPDLLYQFALSLREEGNLSRAENVLRMAISYRKDFADAWNALGEILIRQGKLEEGGRAKQRARSIRKV